MRVLHIGSEEDTVLQDIVATAGTQFHLVVLHVVAAVVPSHLAVEQHVVGCEDATLALQADVEFVGSAVAEVKACERGTSIEFALFELCVGEERHESHCEDCK